VSLQFNSDRYAATWSRRKRSGCDSHFVCGRAGHPTRCAYTFPAAGAERDEPRDQPQPHGHGTYIIRSTVNIRNTLQTRTYVRTTSDPSRRPARRQHARVETWAGPVGSLHRTKLGVPTNFTRAGRGRAKKKILVLCCPGRYIKQVIRVPKFEFPLAFSFPLPLLPPHSLFH
jgi:hypothetical protein